MFKPYDIVKAKTNISEGIKLKHRVNDLILITRENCTDYNKYREFYNFCGNAVHMNSHLPVQ
jgi:hypothetical protein